MEYAPPPPRPRNPNPRDLPGGDRYMQRDRAMTIRMARESRIRMVIVCLGIGVLVASIGLLVEVLV